MVTDIKNQRVIENVTILKKRDKTSDLGVSPTHAVLKVGEVSTRFFSVY